MESVARDEECMRLALEEARAAMLEGFLVAALKLTRGGGSFSSAVFQGEVPVGCVLVNRQTGAVLARAGNETNRSRNGTSSSSSASSDSCVALAPSCVQIDMT